MEPSSELDRTLLSMFHDAWREAEDRPGELSVAERAFLAVMHRLGLSQEAGTASFLERPLHVLDPTTASLVARAERLIDDAPVRGDVSLASLRVKSERNGRRLRELLEDSVAGHAR